MPNEKARQKGAKYLGLHMPDRVVRVQSITEQYLAKLSPEEAVDMFRLGVRERNIRLLYVRPYMAGIDGKSIGDTNLAYISDLKKEIEKYGFIIGKAYNSR